MKVEIFIQDSGKHYEYQSREFTTLSESSIFPYTLGEMIGRLDCYGAYTTVCKMTGLKITEAPVRKRPNCLSVLVSVVYPSPDPTFNFVSLPKMTDAETSEWLIKMAAAMKNTADIRELFEYAKESSKITMKEIVERN